MPITTYISDSKLRQSLADQLGKADASILSFADGTIAECNIRAYQDIISRLGARSFTQSQIDAWDRREEFNRDLALFWLFSVGSIPHNFAQEAIKNFDRRKELEVEGFRLLIGNNPVLPAGGGQESAGGSIGYGMSNFASGLPTEPPTW
jgi:hypothetical protein